MIIGSMDDTNLDASIDADGSVGRTISSDREMFVDDCLAIRWRLRRATIGMHGKKSRQNSLGSVAHRDH